MDEHLDRAVARADCCTLHSHAVVYNVDVVSSDHSVIFIDVERPRARARRKRFMFENAWLKERGCSDVVCQVWN